MAGAGGGPQTEGGGGGQRGVRGGDGGGEAGGERHTEVHWPWGPSPQSALVQVSGPSDWTSWVWRELPGVGPGQSGQWWRLHLLRQ